MTHVFAAADLELSQLRKTLDELEFEGGDTPRCWLEAADGWCFDFWTGCDRQVHWQSAAQPARPLRVAELLERLTQGRVFARSGELRWRWIPSLADAPYRTLFIGEAAQAAKLSLLSKASGLEGLTPDTVQYPLWGQMTHLSPGEWIDLRLPHRFVYPVAAVTPSSGQVIAKLVGQLWRDRRGDVHFFQLCDVVSHVED